MSDKTERQVSVYLDTPEEKKRLEREAKRIGITMSKLVKLALEIGRPIVVQNMRKMQQENAEAMKTITDKTTTKV
jgi:hypothetical protein